MNEDFPLASLTKRRWRVRRVRMLAFGVTALALSCLFGFSTAQAQLLDGTVHAAKLTSSAVAYVPMAGFVKEGGKVAVPVVLRATGPDPNRGGSLYTINALSGAGPGPCLETPLGTLATYTGESEGLVTLLIIDFPGPGQRLRGHLFVELKTTPGKAGLKTVAGWTEVEDTADPEPDGISKKAQLKTKEKEPAKLVDCAIP